MKTHIAEVIERVQKAVEHGRAYPESLHHGAGGVWKDHTHLKVDINDVQDLLVHIGELQKVIDAALYRKLTESPAKHGLEK